MRKAKLVSDMHGDETVFYKGDSISVAFDPCKEMAVCVSLLPDMQCRFAICQLKASAV